MIKKIKKGTEYGICPVKINDQTTFVSNVKCIVFSQVCSTMNVLRILILQNESVVMWSYCLLATLKHCTILFCQRMSTMYYCLVGPIVDSAGAGLRRENRVLLSQVKKQRLISIVCARAPLYTALFDSHHRARFFIVTLLPTLPCQLLAASRSYSSTV